MVTIEIINCQTKHVNALRRAYIYTGFGHIVVADVGNDDVKNYDVTFIVGFYHCQLKL